MCDVTQQWPRAYSTRRIHIGLQFVRSSFFPFSWILIFIRLVQPVGVHVNLTLRDLLVCCRVLQGDAVRYRHDGYSTLWHCVGLDGSEVTSSLLVWGHIIIIGLRSHHHYWSEVTSSLLVWGHNIIIGLRSHHLHWSEVTSSSLVWGHIIIIGLRSQHHYWSEVTSSLLVWGHIIIIGLRSHHHYWSEVTSSSLVWGHIIFIGLRSHHHYWWHDHQTLIEGTFMCWIRWVWGHLIFIGLRSHHH